MHIICSFEPVGVSEKKNASSAPCLVSAQGVPSFSTASAAPGLGLVNASSASGLGLVSAIRRAFALYCLCS
jgi:hypothetical protein